MDLNDYELTDAQKNFLAHSYKPSQKVFILLRHHGKTYAKGIDKAVGDELRRRQEQS